TFATGDERLPLGHVVSGVVSNLFWKPGSVLILRWFNDWGGSVSRTEQLMSVDDLRFEAIPSPEPMFFAEGKVVLESAVTNRGPALVSMETAYPGGVILYTLDGSEPGLASRLYTGPVAIARTSKLRAIAFNTAFSESRQSRVLKVVILPALSADTLGGGLLSVEPPSGGYRGDHTASVSATPLPGWDFLHWLGDADGTNREAVVAMTFDRNLRAIFGTQLSTHTLGAGSVDRFPAALWTPYGASVRLSAVPAPGNYFAFWSGAAVGTDTRISLSVTSAAPSITAVFQPLPTGQVSLTISETGLGRVELNASGSRFAAGRRLRLTAIPAPGQTFLGWGGGATGSDLVLETVMDASKHIVAAFTQLPTLGISSPLSGITPEGFRFTIFGVPGDVYAVGGFRLPGEWGVLGLITNRYGVEQWRDSASRRMGYRFYGMRSP
ncbi:MAG: chitobiase/beta-hexosaminidase C-terminal domain-containing protein, partial [Verrucomicrobiales bacterium]|nr:chitobiase/beta-hexosaminidase C-terminal domain-containing protein [Verrucomicrobiales bacterium]